MFIWQLGQGDLNYNRANTGELSFTSGYENIVDNYLNSQQMGLFNKISTDVDLDEMKDFARNMITMQMTQYGQTPPEEKEMEGIILRVLSNEEESRRLQDQLMSQKMLTLYKNNGPIKEKVISFDAFIKEAYGRE